MQNEISGLEKGISDLAVRWGLKIEFSEPVGQIAMAVEQCLREEELAYSSVGGQTSGG